ncbi:hypothetical protein HanXRQr2_Chr17g0813991 [Helianthus annuus]|uniref:Uncharacterized protein n=1 Tax=Helianthus annuus TaxID=4232 RepID=A0A9K3DJ23_HELAN|nr:hypothetical protein HanXRQr2_Chr17g0813991 [Helianthus annuus]
MRLAPLVGFSHFVEIVHWILLQTCNINGFYKLGHTHLYQVNYIGRTGHGPLVCCAGLWLLGRVLIVYIWVGPRSIN